MSLIFADKAKQMGATAYTPCAKWETFRVDRGMILFEPGVYQGDGSENRVNVCVSSPEAVDCLQEFEKQLEGNVCSCVKERDNLLQHVKAKLIWDRIRFFNAENEKVSKPPKLSGYICNVIFAIKGRWASHGQTGLCLEVTDIQLLEPREQEYEYKSPFA